MAIYGIGAKYGSEDVSSLFIENKFVGTGWEFALAPDLHEYFRSIDVGDIVYIKSCSYSSNITVKAIGIIIDDKILTTSDHVLTEIGRNVKWIFKQKFAIERPSDQKNNVRANTIYQEFHPDVITSIMTIVNSNL